MASMDGPRFLSARVRNLPAFSGLPTATSLARDLASKAPVLLHLNESPFPPSPRVVEAVCQAASGVNRYGDPRPDDLAAVLSQRTGVAPARIVVGNGSDEVLGLVAMMALGPGDSAVMPTPSFPRYRIGTTIMGAQARLVRNLPDGRNDVAGLLKAIDASTTVVFACTPNNPSGAPMTRADLDALVHGVPDDVLLVMDEAYYEFDAAEGGEGALPALRLRQGPWLSTRTLSKAYALAGLRIGYGLASSEELALGLVRVKLNFNLSSLSVVAAIAALEDDAYAQSCMARTIAERERVASALSGMGYPPLPSRANFLSFDCGVNSVPVISALARQRVFIREWRDPGFETYARMTIGLPQENDRTLQLLAEALAQA